MTAIQRDRDETEQARYAITLSEMQTDIKGLKTNLQDSFDKINRIIEELKDIRQSEETVKAEVKDMLAKAEPKSARKEQADPINLLLEERVSRMHDLLMDTRNSLEAKEVHFNNKLNDFGQKIQETSQTFYK